MSLKDTLTPLSVMASNEALLFSTINSRVTQLKIRDEELADKVQSQLIRELIKVEFDNDGTIRSKVLPNGWDILKISNGINIITHTLGNAQYIVIPSSGSFPVISNVDVSSFTISTYNKYGASTLSNFSCFVLQY